MPTYDNKNAATVTVAKGKNPRQLFKHQEAAIRYINIRYINHHEKWVEAKH